MDLFNWLYFLFMDPCKRSLVVFSNGLAHSLSDWGVWTHGIRTHMQFFNDYEEKSLRFLCFATSVHKTGELFNIQNVDVFMNKREKAFIHFNLTLVYIQIDCASVEFGNKWFTGHLTKHMIWSACDSPFCSVWGVLLWWALVFCGSRIF